MKNRPSRRPHRKKHPLNQPLISLSKQELSAVAKVRERDASRAREVAIFEMKVARATKQIEAMNLASQI